MKKSNLDERQEQALAKIEGRGCWISFWGLLIAMAIQFVVFDFDEKMLAGEWIVFMILCIYLAGASLKEGIWSKREEPNMKTNLLASLASGVTLGMLVTIGKLLEYPDRIAGCIATGALVGGFTFVVAFLVLALTAMSYNKRKAKLESEPEEEEE